MLRDKLMAQQQARVDALRRAKHESLLDGNPAIMVLRGEACFHNGRTLTVLLPPTGDSKCAVRFDRGLI